MIAAATIMRATPRDLDQVTSVLMQAYLLDDFSHWVIGDAADRAIRGNVFFRVLTRAFLDDHIVEVTPNRTGVALWARLPAHHRVKIPDYQRSMARILGEHLARYQALDIALNATHPTDLDHDYLALLAVRPDRQHHGIGSALLAHHLAELDREDRAAYVSATGPRAHRLFVRHEFVDLGIPVGIGEDGPWMQPMWRESAPRQAAVHQRRDDGHCSCGERDCTMWRRSRAAMARAGIPIPLDEDEETEICTACHGKAVWEDGRWVHDSILGKASNHDPVLPPIA